VAGLKQLGISVPDENVLNVFTPWIPWNDRSAFDVDGWPLGTYSGVYVLAHFDTRRPRGFADPVDRRIIYVGEGGWFQRRWYNFQRSIGGHAGHSGGHSYRRTFKRKVPLQSLHVAALPIWLKRSEPDPEPANPCSLTCRLRHHVEQALLWHHFYRKSGAELLNKR
jgi:hypothetical protein